MSRTSQAKILVDRSGERRTDGMKTVMIHGTAGAIANAKVGHTVHHDTISMA